MFRETAPTYSPEFIVNSFIAFHIKALFMPFVYHFGTPPPWVLTFSETPYTLCA